MGQLSFEAAAGSGGMIVSIIEVRVDGGQDRYRMRRRVSRLPGLTVGVVMDRV
jgi:hypothetical protein